MFVFSAQLFVKIALHVNFIFVKIVYDLYMYLEEIYLHFLTQLVFAGELVKIKQVQIWRGIGDASSLNQSIKIKKFMVTQNIK